MNILAKPNRIEKLLTFLIFLYLMWYREALHVNNIVFYGLFFALTGMVFIKDITSSKTVKISTRSFIFVLLLFGIYSLATGGMVAANFNYMVSSLITYFGFVILCCDIQIISNREGSIKWILEIIVICALVCALYTIFFGVTFRSTDVYVQTMNINNNPNYLSTCIYAGIFALLFDFDRFYRRPLIHSVLLGIFVYTIFLAGSRKYFIALALTLIVWIVLVFTFKKEVRENKNRNRDLFVNIVIFAVVVGGLYYISSNLTSTSVYQKLLMTKLTGQGISGRADLYDRAIELFWKSPVIGVGFDQYRIVSGADKISHSVYAEVLSCTGIIGTLIFFIPLFSLYFRTVKTGIRVPKTEKYSQWMLITLFTVLLLLGTGTSFIYEWMELVLLTIISWHDLQSLRDVR